MGLKEGKNFPTPKNFFSNFALLFKKRCYVGKIKSKYSTLTVFLTSKLFRTEYEILFRQCGYVFPLDLLKMVTVMVSKNKPGYNRF